MPEQNRGVDGLRVALEMERRGRALYLRARQYTANAELLQMLTELAEDEKTHYEQFSHMLEELGADKLSPEENELAAARASQFFFPGGLMEFSMDGALCSVEDLLGKASQAERDSIAFYSRLCEHMPETRRGVVLDILREEEGHLRALINRQEKTSGRT